MPALRSSFLIVVAALAADAPPPLRVIRTTPAPVAEVGATITVTFDRPVAGSLERSVDPRGLLTIEPALRGTTEWRDPVTLRFQAAEPLAVGTAYTVTVRPDFQALDGSRLSEPHRFGFRVGGPRILAGLPAGPGEDPRHLTPDETFTLALSAPAASGVLERLGYFDFPACSGAGRVGLRVSAQRPIPRDASWRFREAGGWDRDRSVDSLRRLVTVRPATSLPRGCRGFLVLPEAVDPERPGAFQRFPFETYGAFRIDSVSCAGGRACPTGPIRVRFSTPVRGAEVLRHVSILPATEFTVSDTAEVRDTWTLWAELAPRKGYLVQVAPAIRDGFGQSLAGNPRRTVVTTGFQPDISYLNGRLTIERSGPRTLPVTHVNVDTLEVLAAAVPESLEAKLLSRSWYSWNEDWAALAPTARVRRLPVRNTRDRHGVFGVPFDAPAGAGAGWVPTLFAVKVTSRLLPRPTLETGEPSTADYQPVALVQITDLGVHAKVGREEGVVWVTGASDGRPRAGVTIRLRDASRRLLAQGVTDAAGIYHFTGIGRAAAAAGDDEEPGEEFEGYVEARLGADRALVGVNQYDPDLSPWRFNVSGAWGANRWPVAGAVFTERGIYRPGDSVFAKAIVRSGTLGSLRVPAPQDSLRLTFQDRDGGALATHTTVLSAFGTADRVLRLPADAPLGDYTVQAAVRREGEWQEIASATYRVAEYRAPEFLVDVTADTAARRNGDTLRATIAARYLFGAPMARARLNWSVRQRSIPAYELSIPGAEGWFVAQRGWWYEEWDSRPGSAVTEARSDSLDAAGQLVVDAPLVLADPSLPARVSVDAVVTDVNRQTVYGSASVVVHPTDFYVGARPAGRSYFWSAGRAESIDVVALRPEGSRVAGVPVTGRLIRREWHQVRRESGGYSELVGEWVQDTVDQCRVRTAADPVTCSLTPARPGSYIVAFAAADGAGRPVTTSFYRWATGPGWVPWADGSQFKMDVIPDRSRYAVGDTATVLFASPFTDAEAWVTVEREGLIEQRRLRIADGATSLRLPVTEAWAPNAFVSIVVARGRTAAPGPLDDPGRPTIRVGYAEVRVTPERKRLAVSLVPDRTEYRPGTGAAITASVRDAGRGVRSEVTLWAVDEGVLSLTGYRTPDPIALLYQPRGLGLRLGSNLTSVVPQVAQGDKGRNPGGGGGEGAAEILRSRFRSTAFFLGSVITDSTGNGTARVTLPDNLTTFRVMAVAVTAGDRYGSGQSPLLVTRPLIARPALPRFLRPGDVITAGVVVNHRTGGTPSVEVKASAEGVRLEGRSSQKAVLEAGRGRELRFGFRAREADSAVFRFDVAGDGDRDAVRVAIPVRPAYRPTISTVAGVLTDTARVTLPVATDTDQERSTVTLNLGSSPTALLRGFADDLRIYPYYCSEQVSSVARPLIALYRARGQAGTGDTASLRRDIERAVALLVRRQREDGAIGLWSAADWSSASMTAHAGAVLLEARQAGIAVPDTVMGAIAGYLTTSLERPGNLALSVGLRDTDVRAALTERVAVAELLSRLGRQNRPLENELVRRLGQMAPEDRMEFAITLVRAGDQATARRILTPFWAVARIEGRTVALPDSLASRYYFRSAVRTPALLLLATLAVEPSHPLLPALLETVVARGRDPGTLWLWNTQDYAMAVRAVDAWQRRFPPGDRPGLEMRAAGRRVLSVAPGGAVSDSVLSLRALTRGRRGPVSLDLAGTGDRSGMLFYYLTLSELPRTAPTAPVDRGIQVERWYEDYRTGRPVTSATEGDLVRVRLRITVPSERSFVVLDDPLPAGLEAIDLSLRTVGGIAGPGEPQLEGEGREGPSDVPSWSFGSWDAGWWSPFDHRELRDDRVVYAARLLWAGSYTATYLARATTPGTFVRPQTHAEEMYNRAVFGRSDAGVFEVRRRP